MPPGMVYRVKCREDFAPWQPIAWFELRLSYYCPPPIFPNRYTTFYSHLVISSREFQAENNRPARRQRRAVTIDKGGTANPWHGAPALLLNAVDSALKLDTTGNDPCAVSSVSFIWSDLFI